MKAFVSSPGLSIQTSRKRLVCTPGGAFVQSQYVPLRNFSIHRTATSFRRIPLRMSSQQPEKSSNRDNDDSDPLSSSAPLNAEEDETFVLDSTSDEAETFVMEDDILFIEPEEETRIIWNKTPTPSAIEKRSFWTDGAIIAAIVAIVYGLVITTGRLFSSAPYSMLSIDTSLRVLPWYAAQSVTRMVAGYGVSLIFSLTYAYIAYRVKFAAQVLMLVIDVLQSIPLLSFLPGVVLGLIAIFPGARIGVELAAVLLLFTSMAWNMLLGFYQSLVCIPNNLVDVAKTFKLSPWKRFWTLELPAGAIGLVWNSVISVAGGWFFLISIESFELGNRDFKLPGLGSYLAVAAENSNYAAIFAGLAVVIAIILVIDILVWRPLISWSQKFTYGGNASDENQSRSVVLNALQRSPMMRSLHTSFTAPAWEAFVNLQIPDIGSAGNNSGFNGSDISGSVLTSGPGFSSGSTSASSGFLKNAISGVLVACRNISVILEPVFRSLVGPALVIVMTGGVGYGVWQSVQLVEVISGEQWVSLGTAAIATFGRVIAALALSLLWTVPAGVAIGRNAKLAGKLQPVVQVAASVPATALFPFMLLFLAKLGGGLEIGSIALMMLGTMWYVLFNVIAGTQAIPPELFDVDSVYNKEGPLKRWRTLVLPGIFPYLITGVVTAVGGAWNASIVSEYVVFQGGIMKTHGLGSLISEAAASGNYALLLAGTVVMSLLVLLTNRFVWGPLYKLAETKYRV